MHLQLTCWLELQGLRQGDGTPENPYVFVEMGPNSMTVNSISAEVVTTDENGVPASGPGETPGILTQNIINT